MAKEEKRKSIPRRSEKIKRRSNDSTYSKPERRQDRDRRSIKDRRKKH